MEVAHEAETYLDEMESAEAYSESVPATGAQRVLRLSLILLVLILATAAFFLFLLPAIQGMIQPPLPPLAPAVQI